MNDVYFIAHFEIHSYPMLLFYCIWKYGTIWTWFRMCILRWDRIPISFYSVFRDLIWTEYGLTMYFGIQMCRRMLWDLILRYSICWCFISHHIQKYHTIWTGYQPYLKKRRVVERWCDCCLRKRRAVSRPCSYCLERRRTVLRRCAHCLERRRVDQRWCAYCLRKRRTVSRCRACSEGKRRAKRCAFDGGFLCRSVRIASGWVGIQKRRNGPISGASRQSQML